MQSTQCLAKGLQNMIRGAKGFVGKISLGPSQVLHVVQPPTVRRFNISGLCFQESSIPLTGTLCPPTNIMNYSPSSLEISCINALSVSQVCRSVLEKGHS